MCHFLTQKCESLLPSIAILSPACYSKETEKNRNGEEK